MQNLPPEIVSIIVSETDPVNQIQLQFSSKKFHSLVNSHENLKVTAKNFYLPFPERMSLRRLNNYYKSDKSKLLQIAIKLKDDDLLLHYAKQRITSVRFDRYAIKSNNPDLLKFISFDSSSNFLISSRYGRFDLIQNSFLNFSYMDDSRAGKIRGIF